MVNNNFFEDFSEIKLSDSQKKRLYDNIIKNKTSPKIERKAKPLFYIMSLSTVTLIIIFCFSVKTFYDSNNTASKLYSGKENEIVSNEGNIGEKENSEIIVNKPHNKNKELLLAPKKSLDKTQDSINEDVIVYNQAIEENIEEYDASSDIFSDFEASQESAEEESKNRENEKISSGGGSSSNTKINFSEYDELLNNEKFGEYFPLSQMKGYSFSSGYIDDNYAVLYFNSDFYSLTVTVNLLTENSAYGKISVEREDDNGRYFDVPTEKALITYFVSDKECKKEDVYLMLHSAKYFLKKGK